MNTTTTNNKLRHSYAKTFRSCIMLIVKEMPKIYIKI